MIHEKKKIAGFTLIPALNQLANSNLRNKWGAPERRNAIDNRRQVGLGEGAEDRTLDTDRTMLEPKVEPLPAIVPT